MRTWLLISSLAFCCGCGGVNDRDLLPREVMLFNVSRSELDERGGLLFSKSTQQPFTGTLVEYAFGKFTHTDYINGVKPKRVVRTNENGKGLSYEEVFEEVEDSDAIEMPLGLPVAEQAVYLQAFRDVVAQEGVGWFDFPFLEKHGTEDDLPALFHALKQLDAEPHMYEDGKRVFVDTQGFCVRAMEKIVKERPGYTYPEWEAWWKRTHNCDVPKWSPKKVRSPEPIDAMDSR